MTLTARLAHTDLKVAEIIGYQPWCRLTWPPGSKYSRVMARAEDRSTLIKRKLPNQLKAEAAAVPGGWLYEIDATQVTDPNGYVPPEAIAGAYEVGKTGRATGWYRPNPIRGTVRDDWSKLATADAEYLASRFNSLFWLPAAPSVALRDAIFQSLSEQEPGCTLEWVKVISDPKFVTAGPREEDDPATMRVRRAGIAIEFALAVKSSSGSREILVGSFTWAATGLDNHDARRDRVWFDPRMPLDSAVELLESRVFELSNGR